MSPAAPTRSDNAGSPGTTSNRYDVNGNLVAVGDST
jgi:hypothetical protein